jgi:hypothetical protein
VVQFPVFADTNKHHLTSIRDTPEGVASLRALEWLGGCRSEMVALDIQVGKTKILQMPWGIMKDKEHFEF